MTNQPKRAQRILVLGPPNADGTITDDVAALVRLVLHRQGYQVLVAGDLNQAANLLKFAEWDLIIATSLAFWGQNEIFQNPPREMVRLALSANSSLYRPDEPGTAEMFLKKPFDAEELILLVDSLLG